VAGRRELRRCRNPRMADLSASSIPALLTMFCGEREHCFLGDSPNLGIISLTIKTGVSVWRAMKTKMILILLAAAPLFAGPIEGYFHFSYATDNGESANGSFYAQDDGLGQINFAFPSMLFGGWTIHADGQTIIGEFHANLFSVGLTYTGDQITAFSIHGEQIPIPSALRTFTGGLNEAASTFTPSPLQTGKVPLALDLVGTLTVTGPSGVFTGPSPFAQQQQASFSAPDSGGTLLLFSATLLLFLALRRWSFHWSCFNAIPVTA